MQEARSRNRAKPFVVGLFFLAVFLLGLVCYRDYGIPWDEPTQRQTGAVSFKYVAQQLFPSMLPSSLAAVPQMEDWPDRDYGVAFELPAFALELVFGVDDPRSVYLFRHLLIFLVCFAGMYAFYRLAERRFGDWKFALLTTALLILSPRIFADSFYNSKDLVFLASFTVALNATIGFLLTPTLPLALLAALATGIAMDVRIMAVLLVPTTVAALALRSGHKGLPWKRAIQLCGLYLGSTAAVVVALFPWLWSHPLDNFLQLFANMSQFRWGGKVLFFGAILPASHLPWYYVPAWMALTTPPLYLGLFLLGTCAIVRRWVVTRVRLWRADADLQDMLFLAMFFAPLTAVVVLRSVLYDGWRQLYFIYPSFLMIGSIGLFEAFKLVRGKRYARTALSVIVCGSLAYTSYWMYKAHPLQSVYFNAFAGHNLNRRFDLDYWGLSNRMALEHILRADKHPEICVDRVSYTPVRQSAFLLPPGERSRLVFDCDASYPDYVITNYRIPLQFDPSVLQPYYEVFYDIRVGNEVILTIFKLRSKSPPPLL